MRKENTWKQVWRAQPSYHNLLNAASVRLAATNKDKSKHRAQLVPPHIITPQHKCLLPQLRQLKVQWTHTVRENTCRHRHSLILNVLHRAALLRKTDPLGSSSSVPAWVEAPVTQFQKCFYFVAQRHDTAPTWVTTIPIQTDNNLSCVLCKQSNEWDAASAIWLVRQQQSIMRSTYAGRKAGTTNFFLSNYNHMLDYSYPVSHCEWRGEPAKVTLN